MALMRSIFATILLSAVLFFPTACRTVLERGQVTSLGDRWIGDFVVSAESGYIDCSDECIAAIRSAADWSVSDDLVLETKSLDIKPIPIKWREFVSQAGTEFNFREFSVQGVRIQARPNVRVAAGGSAGDKKVSVSFPKLASVAMLYTARQDPHETLSEKLTAAAETFVIGAVTVR